jgi:hypothetical protein
MNKLTDLSVGLLVAESAVVTAATQRMLQEVEKGVFGRRGNSVFLLCYERVEYIISHIMKMHVYFIGVNLSMISLHQSPVCKVYYMEPHGNHG